MRMKPTFMVLLLVLAMASCQEKFTVTPPGIVDKASRYDADRDAILSLAGLFNVETTSGTASSSMHGKTSTERVLLIEETPLRIDLQHVIVVEGPGLALKFWREQWEWGPVRVIGYDAGLWSRSQTKFDGPARRWTRTVFASDDQPLYASVGGWTHEKDGSHWSGDRAYSPVSSPIETLTGKDFWALNDRITIGSDGIICYRVEADGIKADESNASLPEAIRRRFESVNTPRPDPATDDAAERYWQDTADFWAAVRAAWDGVLEKRVPFTVREEVDGQPLWKRVFALAEEARVDPDARDWRGEVDALLDQYVVPVRAVAE